MDLVLLTTLSLIIGFINIVFFFYLEVEDIIRVYKRKQYLKKKRERYKNKSR